MINQNVNTNLNADQYVRVPLSALQVISDALGEIDWLQRNIITNNQVIKDKVAEAHQALENAMGNHAHLIYVPDESEHVSAKESSDENG